MREDSYMGYMMDVYMYVCMYVCMDVGDITLTLTFGSEAQFRRDLHVPLSAHTHEP